MNRIYKEADSGRIFKQLNVISEVCVSLEVFQLKPNNLLLSKDLMRVIWQLD